MGITLSTLTARGGGIVNANSTDVTSVETIQAAPATGLSIHVHSLLISSGSAITVTIGEGATPTTSVLVGPLHMAANTQVVVPINPSRPIKLTAATALTVDAGGAGNVTIFAETSVKK